MATIYHINKGVSKSPEFKGIKAQYIIYLAGGLVVLLITMAILYATGINMYLVLALIIPAAIALILTVQHLSKKYGEHGLTRRKAANLAPDTIQSQTRKLFTKLAHEKEIS